MLRIYWDNCWERTMTYWSSETGVPQCIFAYHFEEIRNLEDDEELSNAVENAIDVAWMAAEYNGRRKHLADAIRTVRHLVGPLPESEIRAFIAYMGGPTAGVLLGLPNPRRGEFPRPRLLQDIREALAMVKEAHERRLRTGQPQASESFRSGVELAADTAR